MREVKEYMLRIPPITSWEEEREYHGNYALELQENLIDFRNILTQRFPDASKDFTEEKITDFISCYDQYGTFSYDYFRYQLFDKTDVAYRDTIMTRHRRDFANGQLNDGGLIAYLSDKVLFAKHWDAFFKRKWCEMRQTKREDFLSMFAGAEKVVAKPISGRAGHGVRVIEIKDEAHLSSIYSRYKKSRRDWAIEEYIKQEGLINSFNPTSLNTIRMLTLKKDDQIFVFSAMVRVGGKGAVLDNMHAGGVGYPVRIEDGIICPGYDYNGHKHSVHPETGIKIAGEKIPNWDKVKQFCIDAHRIAPEGLNLIGWDVCISGDEYYMIEGNAQPGIPNPINPDEDQWKIISECMRKEPEENLIVIHEPVVSGKRVIYSYELSGPWKRYFELGLVYEIAYGFSLKEIPKSILMVPFIATILPLIWLADATAKIPMLDADFYESLDKIKAVYKEKYPQIEFGGNLIVDSVEKNEQPATMRGDKEIRRSMLMFSGSENSNKRLARHKKEKPDLLMIWGVNIHSKDLENWLVAEKAFEETGEKFGVKAHTAKSTFRSSLKSEWLNILIKEAGLEDWWQDFEKDIAILSQAAPLCWKRKIKNVYMTMERDYQISFAGAKCICEKK